jgi:predicted cupin superfamily sugar epimerase
MNEDARIICDRLELARHPEGGWYRETWRAETASGQRAAGTAILFLLAAAESSHWHRVDATELWFWHGGDPLDLDVSASDAGPVRTTRLGGAGDMQLQGLVAAGQWQAARPAPGPAGYVLVSCVVVPGFEFDGFTLAPAGWAPGG